MVVGITILFKDLTLLTLPLESIYPDSILGFVPTLVLLKAAHDGSHSGAIVGRFHSIRGEGQTRAARAGAGPEQREEGRREGAPPRAA
jgi:hypothetical protein